MSRIAHNLIDIELDTPDASFGHKVYVYSVTYIVLRIISCLGFLKFQLVILVMAGRVQLETSGPQDAFFTDYPEYTYFIKNFQKHTNFAPFFVDLDVQG